MFDIVLNCIIVWKYYTTKILCRKAVNLLFRTVCNRLEDVSLAVMVSSHKIFMELLQGEEKKILMEQIRKSSVTVNLSAKPLPSFYDTPGTSWRIQLFNHDHMNYMNISSSEELFLLFVFCSHQCLPVWISVSLNSSSFCHWILDTSNKSSSSCMAWPNDPSGGLIVRSGKTIRGHMMFLMPLCLILKVH